MLIATIPMKGEEIMTDIQFKSILEMVRQILNRSNDLEDAKKAISAILGEKDQ